MKLALPAPYPVGSLAALGGCEAPGHHATWLPRISRLLQRHSDFEIHWLTCSKEVSEIRVIEENGQTFHILPRGSLGIQMLSRFRHERRELLACLKRIQPDLVHAWGTEEGYGHLAVDWPGKSVLSMQGILTECCRAVAQPLLMRVQAKGERHVMSRIMNLTVESSWGREKLQRLAPQALIQRLEYGVASEFFDLRRQPASNPLVLFVGTLSRLKGVDLLLEVFRDRRLRHVELVLLGDGPLRRMESKMSANVRFLGHRPRSEVSDWMRRTWCLVHPTRADTAPNVVKEARVGGIPVITTPTGGQTDYVVDGRSGYLLQAGNREGMIGKILQITSSLEGSLAMGRTDQQRCRRMLNFERISRNLGEVYANILPSAASVD
ncbi:glycosyltransferase family 4 protein [Haloferula rosea]|uniref:Glycosyltransferase family 4 protein n=1 Tax=Haloferula rosea TaxID=490093 RepID=A0A934R9T7_9BACT|nr:glycosyltransferase family 4 protein [Haloferula rosea]MBK1827804.1 glycosyltransferase family 4 protein [Haloferula rosea]